MTYFGFVHHVRSLNFSLQFSGLRRFLLDFLFRTFILRFVFNFLVILFEKQINCSNSIILILSNLLLLLFPIFLNCWLNPLVRFSLIKQGCSWSGTPLSLRRPWLLLLHRRFDDWLRRTWGIFFPEYVADERGFVLNLMLQNIEILIVQIICWRFWILVVALHWFGYFWLWMNNKLTRLILRNLRNYQIIILLFRKVTAFADEDGLKVSLLLISWLV